MIYLNTKQDNSDIDINDELFYQSGIIKNKIDTCLSTLTDKGMKLMSSQGFYLEIPSIKEYDNATAYWIKETINIMPPKFDDIENELESYIYSNIGNCINFQEFINQGWTISSFDPTIDAQFYEKDINVNAIYEVTIEKEDYKRTLVDSVYIPRIKFRDMYERAADLINYQLLKPDFDIDDPLDNYDSDSYIIDYQDTGDGETLIFSITDPSSKVIDGSDFTLRFAAEFKINELVRTYKAGTQVLYSPDRLAMLYFASGSPADITITQYERDSVTRYQTSKTKVNDVVTEYTDVTFPTRYPIYRFGPSGLDFSGSPAILTIYTNKDQTGGSGIMSLIHTSNDGWTPYPNVPDSGIGAITTMIYGFK